MSPRTSLLSTSVRRLLMLSLVAVALSACARRPAKVRVMHPAGAQVVVIKKGHRHSESCGHYRHGKTWYLVKGHVHKRGCGHHKVDGVWILKR